MFCISAASLKLILRFLQMIDDRRWYSTVHLNKVRSTYMVYRECCKIFMMVGYKWIRKLDNTKTSLVQLSVYLSKWRRVMYARTSHVMNRNLQCNPEKRYYYLLLLCRVIGHVKRTEFYFSEYPVLETYRKTDAT